jgi:xylulokinase
MQAEQDPEDWWRGLVETLSQIPAAIDPKRIAALAITHQRETFAVLDETGNALRPGILWIDERAGDEVESLGREIGIERLREITGKQPDPTPALYALAWLRTHEPDVMARAAKIVDVHGFLVERLTGRARTSTASADPLGLLDTANGDWSDDLLAVVGLDRSHMQELVAPGATIGTLKPDVALATGLHDQVQVIAGGGDGQVAGLGLGVLEPSLAYLSLGSGAVAGLHSDDYRTAMSFRTLTSPSGKGFIYETLIRTCTQLIEWVVDTTGRTLAELDQAAAAISPGADGLFLLPYWSGAATPHWDGSARGTVTGLSLDHTPAHLFRAALEGIALEQASAIDALEAASGRRVEELVITGGGANSTLWCQIVAAACHRPVRRSVVAETACLGAAVLAASGARLYPTIESAASAMVPMSGEVTDPRDDWIEIYGDLKTRHARLYPALSQA